MPVGEQAYGQNSKTSKLTIINNKLWYVYNNLYNKHKKKVYRLQQVTAVADAWSSY